MGGGGGASGSLSPWWRSGCLFKRSVGAKAGARRARFHGTGAAGAAGPRCSLGSSRSRWSRGAQLSCHGASGAGPAAPPALPVATDAQCGRAAAAPTSARHTPPPREPRTQLLPREPNFCAGRGLASRSGAPLAAPAAAGAEPRRPAEVTWRLWLWRFCAWVAASWPPGSALQLRPVM